METELSRAVLEGAMRLTSEERAALAATLIESLDDAADGDAEAAWAEETARRISDIERGRVETLPWAEARKQILAG